MLVTDDGRGVARGLEQRLNALGHPTIIAGTSVDWTSPASIETFLSESSSRGPLAAIIHAGPLRRTATEGLDEAAWSSRIEPDVKGLFLLARAAAADLEKSARFGGSALIAATALGGTFASEGAGDDFFPGHGAVAGLTKTLARELPDVRVRVVDFDARNDEWTLAEHLFAELFVEDSRAEVGYQGERRIELRNRRAAFDFLDSLKCPDRRWRSNRRHRRCPRNHGHGDS